MKVAAMENKSSGLQPVEKHTTTAPESMPEKSPTAEKPRRQTFGRQLVMLVVAAVVIAGAWYAYSHGFLPGHSNAKNSNNHGGKATLGLAQEKSSEKGAEEKSSLPPSGPIKTVVAEVRLRGDVLRLTGTLLADERSAVASNASGIAAEVRVDRGSFVRKGDVLVQIDPTDAQNKLAEGRAMLEELKARLGITDDLEKFDPHDQPEVRLAKASADLAAANFKRASDLYAKKVISSEAFDQAKTELELATQRYRQALLQIRQVYQSCQTVLVKLAMLEKAVADTTIRAPFDGWVAERLVSVGEQISSGMQATKVVILVRIEPLRLALTVPQQDCGRVAEGQKVRFHVDSYPERTFEATVRYISPVLTSDTRSMVIEAVAPNPEGLLRPGMFVTAELEVGNQRSAVFVPTDAIERLGEVARVFVVRDGIAREQVVALGPESNGQVEVLSGLKGGERLVAQPNTVRDGTPVQP